MSVNDILTLGAEPLFFLDYYACGKLDVASATQVVKGIAEGCERAGCALIGGETAEMPDVHAGRIRSRRLRGRRGREKPHHRRLAIAEGDVVLGLASDGAHSNGYSLIRKIIEARQADLAQPLAGRPCGRMDTGAHPHLREARAAAARAGDGERACAHHRRRSRRDVPRVLGDKYTAEIARDAWPANPLFDWLQAQGNGPQGNVSRVQLRHRMVAVVDGKDADRACRLLEDAASACGASASYAAALERSADGRRVKGSAC